MSPAVGMASSRGRILLVEDDPVVLLVERRTLAQGGYDVVPFRNGDDAVETARNAEVDMLVTDIDLGPGMNGIDVAREVLDFKPMPVLFLTSGERSEIAERAKGIGEYDFVKKGASKEDLLGAVERALAERRAIGWA